MIDTELFNQVQNRRREQCEQLGRIIQPNSMKNQNIFTGRLRCGECGEVYRKYIENCGKKNEHSYWKCKRYIYKNRVCCRCGFLTDEQIENAFTIAADRLRSRIQILDRRPKKDPIPISSEFIKLDRRIKELEEAKQYSSKELPKLIFERAKAYYRIKEATALSQAETLCRSLMDEHDKKEIEFFKCIKAGLCKVGGKGKITSNEINARIMKMLEQAIKQDGVVNIFEQSGQKNPEISLLSDEYMAQVRRMKHKNIAAEMLRSLLEDNISRS